MKKRKICVIITTRGNYAKMASVMEAVNEDDKLELQLIVGGGVILPRYGLTIESINGNKFHIDRRIHFMVEGENPVAMAKSAGLAVIDFTTAFENLAPDIVVIIADRFECLSMAMAAIYMNILVAHIEGGEVSGSVDESVRHAITKLAHIHFPATRNAARRIEQLGEKAEDIHSVGSTSLDIISRINLKDINPLMELQARAGVGPVVDLSKPYLVILQHPVTTEYEKNLAHIEETVASVSALRMTTVWIWPNMDAGSDGISKGIRMFREKESTNYIHFFKSLPIEYYAALLNNAACIVGNSSSGIREASYLGVPSVNIGTRQSGRERGNNVVEAPYDRLAIIAAIRKQLEIGRYDPSYVYGRGDAGKKISNILCGTEISCQKRITY